MKTEKQKIFFRVSVIMSIMTISNAVVFLSDAPIVLKCIGTGLIFICSIISAKGFIEVR